MSGDGQQSSTTTTPDRYDAHDDARAIVKLIQCSQCSYPLREPMTLPCGNSLCKPCLPPIYKREHITYPLAEGRSEGFICPFKTCGLEHSVADCGTDVTLNKVSHIIKGCIAKHQAESPEMPVLLEEKLNWSKVVGSSMDIMPRSRVLSGGRLVATYIFADMGELNYHSDVVYTPVDAGRADSIQALDTATLEDLTEAVKGELECQVCYQIMLDPLTTTCGHTFCRRCFSRAMDHSNHCPMCRHLLAMIYTVQAEPSNKSITYLIQHLFPDLLAVRQGQTELESLIDEEMELPLFPCTLAYPRMPTFLHIFEPRYRLMVRRVLETGQRRFGMVSYKPHGSYSEGEPHYMPYGTVLFIERVEMLADGRSLLETRGLHKFRILETGMVDGYLTGRVERIDDIPVREEEMREAHETTTEPVTDEDGLAQLRRMSTQELLHYGLGFVRQAQSRSARWLHERVLSAYGLPPEDAATFPYWLASVLPIAETEKYSLIPTTSVRDRLQITAEWIYRLEQARCEIEAEQAAVRAREEAARFAEQARAVDARLAASRETGSGEPEVHMTNAPDETGASQTAPCAAGAHEVEAGVDETSEPAANASDLGVDGSGTRAT